MILKLKRTPGLFLVGFMGCGKTTIGRALAARIGWHFIDLDHDIEKAHKGTIQQIFRENGEAHFRRLESEALQARVREIERGRPSVVALGGGAFVQPNNYALLENNGVTLWLDAPFDLICKRVPLNGSRPLAADPDQLRALFETRKESYRRADHHVTIVSEDAEETVNAIIGLSLFGT